MRDFKEEFDLYFYLAKILKIVDDFLNFNINLIF